MTVLGSKKEEVATGKSNFLSPRPSITGTLHTILLRFLYEINEMVMTYSICIKHSGSQSWEKRPRGRL
jgi:hypothetical protein